MRPTPFDLVFRRSAEDVFPHIRNALEQASYEPRDRDQFLMVREVVTLLRDLRPDEGLGEGIDQLAALLHHGYLFWDAEQQVLRVSAQQLADVLSTRGGGSAIDAPAAYYAAVPERRIWAQVVPGHAPEPLDGCFIHSAPDRVALRVLGVFGLHPERDGFSVVEAVGQRPVLVARADGSELFSPTLTGGKAAGLFSITGEEELLDLGWRLNELRAGSWELRAEGSGLGLTSSRLPASSS